MMRNNGWFVNPYNSYQCINLKQIVGMQFDGHAIIFFTHTEQVQWNFGLVDEAKKVYESLVRVAQE